jgi:hypothetical protein
MKVSLVGLDATARFVAAVFVLDASSGMTVLSTAFAPEMLAKNKMLNTESLKFGIAYLFD